MQNYEKKSGSRPIDVSHSFVNVTNGKAEGDKGYKWELKRKLKWEYKWEYK